MNEPVSKIDSLIRAIDTSIHQTTTLFSMLLDELYGTDEPEIPQLIATEDPSTCQHPDSIQILDQQLCNSCGANF